MERPCFPGNSHRIPHSNFTWVMTDHLTDRDVLTITGNETIARSYFTHAIGKLARVSQVSHKLLQTCWPFKYHVYVWNSNFRIQLWFLETFLPQWKSLFRQCPEQYATHWNFGSDSLERLSPSTRGAIQNFTSPFSCFQIYCHGLVWVWSYMCKPEKRP